MTNHCDKTEGISLEVRHERLLFPFDDLLGVKERSRQEGEQQTKRALYQPAPSLMVKRKQ
jgi:hypothetical protein